MNGESSPTGGWYMHRPGDGSATGWQALRAVCGTRSLRQIDDLAPWIRLMCACLVAAAGVACFIEGLVTALVLVSQRGRILTSLGMGFGLLLGVFAFQRGRDRPQHLAPAAAGRGRRPAPVALARGAVRLMPAADPGAAGSPDHRLEADSPALVISEPAPMECWLTRREMQVLRLLATGRTYRQIAAELLLSEETVRSHVKHILHKLDAPDRAHAVACAVRAGILPS